MLGAEDLFEQGPGQEPKGFQIIAGVANTYKQLRNPFLLTEAAVELMSAVSYDPEMVRVWVNKLYALDGEIYEHPKMLAAFKEDVYTSLNARINTLDDVSRAACLNYAATTWMAWGDINPAVFLRPFEVSSGTLVHISGVMGSGKTDLGCTLADHALRDGYGVVTNVAFTGDLPDGLVRCVRLSDLLLEMIDARLDGRDVVVLFDEVSQFFSRRESARSGNIQMEKLLRLTRKFRSSIIFVEQVKGGLPSVALELLSARFHKLGKKKCQYATRNMEKNYNLMLDGIPRTALPFKTLHLGGFRSDVDLGELFRDTLIEEEQEHALRRAILVATGREDEI